MTRTTRWAVALAAAATLVGSNAGAEILALVNYESKTADSLKALKITAPAERREGLMVLDVDPASPNFGGILLDIPLPPDLVAHHIFYDRTMTKAYITALGKPELHIIDMQRFPYRVERLAVPPCRVGEDVIFSNDNRRWYLTCMGSDTVVVGRVATDEILSVIATPRPYPHGLAVHEGIDRFLVTSTVRHTDLGDAGETVTVFQASTGKALGDLRLSDKPAPAAEAPVEILFAPGATPPVAYVTNMYGGSVWTATWNPAAQDFEVAKVIETAELGGGVPLEMYFDDSRDRFYLTTAKPGMFHAFDVGEDIGRPRHLYTLATAEGAHHVAFTKDMRLGFVQNALLNLPGMSDGAITVIDLEAGEVVASVTTLKERGLNPNSIVLLPEWNHLAGH